MSKILGIILVLLLMVSSQTKSQKIESDSIPNTSDLKFHYASLILPGALIGYGVVGLGSDGIKSLNVNIRDAVVENVNGEFKLDDFTEYVPALSVYALNSLKIKGKNSFKNRTIILVTSCFILVTSVEGLKGITNVERPDGNAINSFPSGHTATAFMGAEFLRQEYKNVSVWYGVSGYVVATGTGLLRIYNNRHWLTDVAAGAGIGILSTQIAYWINPYINNKLFRRKRKNQNEALLYPYYNGQQTGLSFLIHL